MTNNRQIPVILDCDNTFGVPGCDVDDGLALLYLLGCPEVRVLGITCTYGNNTLDTVYRNTIRLLDEWGRSDIPVLKGAPSCADRSGEAAAFLAASAAQYAGELRVIATGATTNLLGAQEIDRSFFKHVHTFSLMGGLTEPLYVGGHPMDELNLSCDPAASLSVLQQGSRVMVATAQNCLRSFFPRAEWLAILEESDRPIARYLASHLTYWFDLNETDWDLSGIVNWDVMAAAQLIHPEYFEMNRQIISPSLISLKTGRLIGDGDARSIFLPRITDQSAYVRHIYSTYLSAQVDLRKNNI